MRDPIDVLENFTSPDLTAAPLPASEVRRQGSHLRRRHGVLSGVGGLAAVMALATPVGVATLAAQGPSGDAPPSITTGPAAEDTAWVTTIPAGLPLGAAMGAAGDPVHVGEERGEVVISTLVVCGTSVWTPEEPAATDVLGAVWSDGVEGGQQRTLAVYADAGTAQAALDGVRGAVEGCPDQSTGGGDYIQPVPLEATAGDDALAYLDQYGADGSPTGEAHAFVVTRVGNALLFDRTYMGGGGSLVIAQRTADELTAEAATVVEAMCVFAADPC